MPSDPQHQSTAKPRVRVPARTAPRTLQDVVDDLGITREEAGEMIQHGFEAAAIGARLYSAFLSGEVRERAT